MNRIRSRSGNVSWFDHHLTYLFQHEKLDGEQFKAIMDGTVAADSTPIPAVFPKKEEEPALPDSADDGEVQH